LEKEKKGEERNERKEMEGRGETPQNKFLVMTFDIDSQNSNPTYEPAYLLSTVRMEVIVGSL